MYATAGSVLVAINSTLFVSEKAYTTRADSILSTIKAVPPRPGFAEVLTLGEPEQQARANRLREGISLPDSSWESIRRLAAKDKVDIDAVLSQHG